MSPLDPVKIPEEGEDACSLSSAPEAPRSNLRSANTSPHSTPVKMKKSVSFSTLQIREFNVTLGDNPSTASGPPITLEWQPQRTFSVELDKYEQGLTEPRRSSLELRMPAAVRQKLLKEEHSKRELQRAERDAQRIQHQRQYTYATQEMEELEIFFQSVARKYRRWRRNRSGKPIDPAEAWVQEHKRQTKERKKMKKDELRRRGSCPANTSSTGKSIIPLDDYDDDDELNAPASEPILSCTNLTITKQESSTEASTASNTSQETKEEDEGESSIESGVQSRLSSLTLLEEEEEEAKEAVMESPATRASSPNKQDVVQDQPVPSSPAREYSSLALQSEAFQDNATAHRLIADEEWGHGFDEVPPTSMKMRFL